MSTVLGLDVGASAIKAVLVEDTLRGQFLRKFFHFPYPGMERKEAIRAFFKKHQIRADRLVVSLKGYEGSVRIVSFPFNDEKKISSVLPFELESEFADGVGQRVFRFHPILSRLRQNEKEAWRFLVVGVEEDTVEDFSQEFREARFKPWLLDYDAYANFNCFDASAQKSDEGLSLLIDIGARSTGINIMNADELLYTRSVFFGGNDFTQAIADALNLSFEEAEELKREYGLKENRSPKIDQALKDCLDYLVKEIHLTLGSFASVQGNQEIRQTWLFGGGSTLNGLDSCLARELQMPAVHAHPVEGFKLQAQAPESPLLFSIAIGLALRGLGKGKIRHDFARRRVRMDMLSQKAFLKHSAAITLALAFYASISGVQVLMSYFTVSNLKQQYILSTNQVMQAQQGAYSSLEELQKNVADRKKLLARFALARRSPLWALEGYTELLRGKDVHFEEISLKNGEQASGLFIRGTVPSPADLTDVESLLEKLPGVDRRKRDNTQQDPQSGRYMFEESFRLKEVGS